MVSDELVTEIKVILHNLRASGGVITQKTVIATGNEVLISRYPEKLTKNSGSVILTTKWARGILKSLDWIKRRVATAKRKMNPALYDKFPFTWKKKIADATFEHSIHNEMILNFDQTLLGFTAPNRATFPEKMCSIRADCQCRL